MKFPPNTIHPFHIAHTQPIKKNKSKSPYLPSLTPLHAPLTSHSHHSTNSRATLPNTGHYQFTVGEEMGGYRVTRLLGEGTFGRVVEAQRKGKRFAVKIIRPVGRYIESARIEKDIIKAINRRDEKDEEGILRYKHSFYHAGHFCLVFKPLGCSLYDLLKRNNFRGFPLKSVQSFFRQILKSVSFLHRLGYTHTDLKPENILLEKDGLKETTKEGEPYYEPQSTKVRIIDFGGATLFNQHHSTVICTRQYRPPEVILECCEWNELADVWSIGCIIVELLTGDLLFPTHSDPEHLVMIEKNSGIFPGWMVAKIASSGLRRLWSRGAEINEDEADRQLQHWENVRGLKVVSERVTDGCLRDLLDRCLEIDPNRRITCAAALRHPFFQQRIEAQS